MSELAARMTVAGEERNKVSKTDRGFKVTVMSPAFLLYVGPPEI